MGATNMTIKTRLPWSLSTLPGMALVVWEKKLRLTNVARPIMQKQKRLLNTPSRSNVFAQRTQAEPARQKQPSVQKNQGFHSKRDSLHGQWFSNSTQLPEFPRPLVRRL